MSAQELGKLLHGKSLLGKSPQEDALRTATAARRHRSVVGLVTPAILMAALVCLSASPAAAQTAGSDSDGVWNKMMRSVGLKSAPDPNSDINYTERPPLVVPPSRDLPPPAAGSGAPSENWPKSTAAKPAKRGKNSNEVVPNTAVQNPNPPYEKKPWYNPTRWFAKEEYATFDGEPVRRDLTDPPAGYRTPSAEQPYGVGPEKKNRTVTANDFNMGSVFPNNNQTGR